MWLIKFFSGLILINSVFGGISRSNYCFTNDPNRLDSKRFSTKTAYQYIRGRDSQDFHVPDCEAKRFWLFARHGTRLPSGKNMKNFKNLENVRDQVLENLKFKNHPLVLCPKDRELLKGWKWDNNLTAEYDNFLTDQGWDDLKSLGKAYQERFPQIIGKQYSHDKFKFGHTETQRSEASYKAFVEGIFGTAELDIAESDEKDLSLMRPYENCKSWKNRNYKTENKDFVKSPRYRKVSHEISMRLGFNSTLDPDLIEDIWDMCRYEQAWNMDKLSPWCVAITPEQLDVLEYAEDLHYYYKCGYGSEMNHNLMCSAVQDMLTFIQRNDTRNVFAYHSHASAIQLLMTALNFAKDKTSLLASNFGEMKMRKWKMSKWSSFASNLVVVTYDCPLETEPEKVQFFWNEKLIKDLDFCDDGLCDISKVLEEYQEFLIADCDKTYCPNFIE